MAFSRSTGRFAEYKTEMRQDAKLLEYLRGGGVVVTANARAARALGRDYSLAQQRSGHKAWAAPHIATWKVWLDQLWQQHLFNSDEARLLLSSLQERAVWTRIVAADSAAQQVLAPDALATLAQDAYGLVGEYFASPHSYESFNNPSFVSGAGRDEEAFRSWAAAFNRECRANRWLSRSRLATELAGFMQNGTVVVANEICTLGFERFTPSQQRLLDATEQTGCKVAAYQFADPGSRCELFEANDRSSEIYECAQWLRSRLLINPQERLAVVVTNVQALRSELDRVMRRVLMPASMYLGDQQTSSESLQQPGTEEDLLSSVTAAVTGAAQATAFEFSLGVPLASSPLVRAALLLLRWLAGTLREEEITWLLLSGFLTQFQQDTAQWAQMDARLRARALLPPEVELGDYLKQSRHARTDQERRLFEQLDSLAKAALRSGIQQRDQPPMAWAEEVQTLLSASGWPGSQAQSSLRFQALEKWEKLLSELASLSFDGRRMSYRKFFKAMEQHASETVFAPQSQEAPIQIMGAYESSGQAFDGIWFMGADEDTWPARGSPHPLIPVAVQRAVRMPHASVEIDSELARAATQRIAASAPECVFSYATQDRDGNLRVSPLLSAVLATTKKRTSALSFSPLEKYATAAVALEAIEESAPVRWPPERTAGGVEVLRSQSACAFQAFAAKRLGAADLGCAEWGLTALIRGDLMHKVLQSLWRGDQGLASWDGLRTAIAEDELEPLLERTIAEVFAKHTATRTAEGWIHAYVETEKRRFKRLLSEWLHYEAKRGPFEVEDCEKEIPDLRVGELRLRVRIDRIDRLPDGQKLLIDYKTGETNIKKWECPRPEEPQLPLYATFGGLGEIGGLLFAQIRAGSTEFKGYAPRELWRAKPPARFNPLDEEDLSLWRDELLQLADDFLRGEAAVAPKTYPKTCAYCGRQALCRVAETDVPLKASDVDAPDENGQAPGQ